MSERQYHVLVVEDEAAILSGVQRSIDRQPQLRSSGCYTVDEAVAVLANDPPDLLVTDLNLPGRNGLEMIGELDRAGLMIPIIVVTAYRAVYESAFPKHSDLVVLEKPVPAAVLLDHISNRLETTQAVGPAFQVSDYLQLATMGRHSVVIEVEVGKDESGRMEIVEGDVWNVWLGALSGEEALAALLSRPIDTVATKALSGLPETRQIEQSTSSLLLDLLRRIDESNHLQGQTGSTDAAPAASYAEAFEAGMKAVDREDWQEATDAFSRALVQRPGDARARYNLERIHKILASGTE